MPISYSLAGMGWRGERTGSKRHANVAKLLALPLKLCAVRAQRSLMMLMEYAVSHKDTQLILLTPLNLGAINDAAKRTQAMQPNGEWPAPDFMRIRQMFPAKRAVMRSQAGA